MAYHVPLLSGGLMFKRKTRKEPVNLLTLTPVRKLQWERREDHLVTLVIPKFRSRWLVTWFVPMLAKPNVRVKLDRFGSFFWEQCDGVMNVGRIAEEMAARFGEDPEAMYDRLGRFVRLLEKDGFITITEHEGR
jgi:hypothetical protein